MVPPTRRKKSAALTALYGKRMGIEEFFRDAKSVRNGFALRHTQVRADRFDRPALVLVLAYLLTGPGLRWNGYAGRGRHDHGLRAAAVVGRTVKRWFAFTPQAAALAVLLAATITAGATGDSSAWCVLARCRRV